MKHSPIALFTYARADHTQQAVESLLRNKEAAHSDLYIFSDGPKTEEKRDAVEENRKYIHSIRGFKSIQIIEREKNWGLANSLIAGITDVVNRHGRVIVVEDDLIVSTYFLQYMNEALEKYKDEAKVGAITAYCPVKDENLPETYFLRYFHCWGWGTWKRGWNLFEPDTKKLLKKIRWKTNKFNLDGAVDNYGMLYCQKVGLVDSWFIRLYASFFLAGKLTLFPGRSLVSNHGLDGSGTHCDRPKHGQGDDGVNIDYVRSPITLHSIDVRESQNAYKTICITLKRQKMSVGCMKRTYNSFKSFVRRLLYIDCM